VDPSSWPLWANLLVFLAAAGLIGTFGTMLSGLADRLADRTGLGEAFVGAVMLGACTSLPGMAASVTAAWDGHASIALSNCFGGIAVQTLYLAIADLLYRRVNLEHAAASIGNLFACALLVGLLAVILFATLGPDGAIGWFHPASPLILLFYLAGLKLMRTGEDDPMWRPKKTRATRLDVPEEEYRRLPLLPMVATFAACAAVTVVAGWFLAESAVVLADEYGISHSLMGGMLVATTTSLPELVTTIASVRRGALTLAVGGIIGGNTFDVLFAVISDFAYRGGSIYHAMARDDVLQIVLAIAMTSILLLGLLLRQRRGPGNIGFESVLLVLVYAGGMATIHGFEG